ncbi:hypothetical protein [Streptomyces shaanxiensis]|uniref:Uncharacterized protein n=1 Tax=Streptomyces shaanxiensis TaxID=653357 RepID=A0ABP7WC92_9ACTN
MDSTESARRLLGGGAAPVTYVVPVTGVRAQPSIYAALVAEWQANGRAVPRRRDTWWDSVAVADGPGRAVTSWAVGRWTGLAGALEAAPAGEGHGEETERVPAVVVPRGLPGPMELWEWRGSSGRVSVSAPPTTD